jgi:Apea-like HEPN
LLAIDEDPRALVLPTWFFAIDPLSNISYEYNWRDWQRTSFTPRALDLAAVANWKQWAERIAARRKPGVDVAVRRALLAAAERQSPEDVLVDAVIVWENLFGSNQDTAMRVTVALAWLLSSDAAEREQQYQRLKKIYVLRSKIVHGAHQMTPQEIQTYPQEALDVALEALRRIFEVRSDLIDLKDSNERSNRMLLGG